MSIFPRAMEWLHRIEGGFTDNAADPGGATYAGVALRTVRSLDANADGFLDFDLDGDRDVDREDIRALAGHPEKVEQFYFDRYWKPFRLDELGPPLALFTFDAAVHHGPRPAVVLLQRGLRTHADGVLGFHTLARARTLGNRALEDCLTERADLMRRICQKRPLSWVFYRGWTRRLFLLEREALSL